MRVGGSPEYPGIKLQVAGETPAAIRVCVPALADEISELHGRPHDKGGGRNGRKERQNGLTIFLGGHGSSFLTVPGSDHRRP